MDVDPGALYAQARQRITDLVQEVGPAHWMDEVPAVPGWNVHDVVAHLRGIVEDALAGNMAGAPGEAWTAAQVERGRVQDVRTLLDGWTNDAPAFEAFLSQAGPMGAAGAIDIHAHEHDLRGALTRPSELPDDAARWILATVLGGRLDAVASAGLPPLRVETDEGDAHGPPDAPSVLRASRFELFRAVLGRRSTEQIASMLAEVADGADRSAYVGPLCVFGPRTEDLVEPRP